MKKMLFFAAVAIGMAACTNETDVICQQEPQEISFKAVAYNPTRAAVSGPTFPTTTAMYVSAWQKNDATSQYIKYLSNAEFSYNSDDNIKAWTGGYYYPITGVLHVQAYSCDQDPDQIMPKTATLTGDVSESKITSLELDFTKDHSKLQGSTDVMWSEIGFPEKDDGKYPTIPLKFHHALSWIVVKFSTTNKDDKGNIKEDIKTAIQIKDVKLNGVKLTGKLTVTPTYIDGSVSYNPVWSDVVTPAESPAFPDYVSSDGQITFGTAAIVSNHKGLLVIPGAQDNTDNISISFLYRTKNNSEDGYTDWITYTHTIGPNRWEAEKKYIYDFNITFNEITINPTVVGWDSTNNTTNENL